MSTSTLLPFLYQTRTLQRLARTGAFRALLHSTAAPRDARDRPHVKPLKTRYEDNSYIPFQLPEGYVQDKGDEDAESNSTLTPAEKDVFNRIFEEIATRRGVKSAVWPPPAEPPASAPEDEDAAPAQLPLPNLDNAEVFGVRTEEPQHKLVQNTFNFIIQDITEPRRAKKAGRAPELQEEPAVSSEWDYALQRFPPSLRRAAKLALSTIHEEKPAERQSIADAITAVKRINRKPKDSDELLRKHQKPSTTSVLNEAIRREERIRVEAKMEAARSDFELWDVLEEEVFSLVHKLGIDAVPDKTTESTEKTKKLPLDAYGPLYPAYLLTALRLLDTHFARTSPLALQILPRVKQLGAASYVLGVTTPFYNQLAHIMWNRYGDPAAVFDLLEEMRAAGLYCDETTRKLVLSIQQFFQAVGQGQWGPFVREVASLPEFELTLMPRVRHWIKTANVHIYERKRGLIV
ncbi:hypothetical protein VTJ49DRAFT_3391 [Mycothermus thermophilus]|uniref:Mtf2-like C-terminal domain-containing protein n=1 Tax=Humicola insolens TaxID=85995 RepID=A0ABR3V7N0_HUMIN